VQKPIVANIIKFSPTSPAKISQYLLIKKAKVRLSRIKTPAIKKITLSKYHLSVFAIYIIMLLLKTPSPLTPLPSRARGRISS